MNNCTTEKKMNSMKNHSTPKGLKTFIEFIKYEIIDPKNRNSEKYNYLPVEIEALKNL